VHPGDALDQRRREVALASERALPLVNRGHASNWSGAVKTASVHHCC
jgi:hypothetical protein